MECFVNMYSEWGGGGALFFKDIYNLLAAWEPSVAPGIYSYSRRLPALSRFCRDTINVRFKVEPLTQLRMSKPSQEHSRGSSELPSQNLRQIGQGVSEL